MEKTLIVITGPTASGKSALALSLAKRLGTEIVSADSRQIYRGIPIATAAPTEEEMECVPHHLVATLPLEAYYSASQFRDDAMRIISGIMDRSDYAVVCGGSMMYVDALCNGIDELPTVPKAIREGLADEHSRKGDGWLVDELRRLDSEYAEKVDLKNIKRVFHAVEVSLAAGVPYSSLLTGCNRKCASGLPWKVVKLGIRMPRELLFGRINRRVDAMVEKGLVDEIRRVAHLRHLNSLNTVGVKEMLRHIDGEWDLATAAARLAKNTRVYAKKQMTWLQRDESVRWIDSPSAEVQLEKAICIIKEQCR